MLMVSSAEIFGEVTWRAGREFRWGGLDVHVLRELRVVADELGRETEARPAGEEAVLRIALEEIGGDAGGLAIGGGGDDEAGEGFDVPAGIDEIGGEMVKQVGKDSVNIAKAKELLEAAGWTLDGDVYTKCDLRTEFSIGHIDPNPRRTQTVSPVFLSKAAMYCCFSLSLTITSRLSASAGELPVPNSR